MAGCDYNLDVQFLPSSGSKGGNVKVTATFTGCTSEIRSVYASIPDYGIYETLSKVSDGVYQLTTTVPWDAPSMTYTVVFFARDINGNKGKEVTKQFTVQ